MTEEDTNGKKPLDEVIEHPAMVKQLAKGGKDIIKGLTQSSIHNLHMAVGIAGEFFELQDAYLLPGGTDENVLEEHGDLEFYMEGLRQGTDCTHVGTYDQMKQGYKGTFLAMGTAVGNLVDVVKKESIYGQKLNAEALQEHMNTVDQCVAQLLIMRNITRQNCLDANIAKLGERYKGHKYTDKQAADRNDKKPEVGADNGGGA